MHRVPVPVRSILNWIYWIGLNHRGKKSYCLKESVVDPNYRRIPVLGLWHLDIICNGLLSAATYHYCLASSSRKYGVRSWWQTHDLLRLTWPLHWLPLMHVLPSMRRSSRDGRHLLFLSEGGRACLPRTEYAGQPIQCKKLLRSVYDRLEDVVAVVAVLWAINSADSQRLPQKSCGCGVYRRDGAVVSCDAIVIRQNAPRLSPWGRHSRMAMQTCRLQYRCQHSRRFIVNSSCRER